jgi:alpha-galactosidase
LCFKVVMRFSAFKGVYVVDGQHKEISAEQFTFFDNDDITMEFTVDDLGVGKIYSVEIDPKRPLEWISFAIYSDLDYSGNNGIFCNGFQSWTDTKVFNASAILKPARKILKGVAYKFGDYSFYDYPRRPGRQHSWTYTYIKREKNRIELLASLKEENGYTFFEHDSVKNRLTIQKEVRGKVSTAKECLLHFLHARDSEKQAFETYANAKGFKEIPAKPAIGWTSWYYYYTGITEQIIYDNLEQFHTRNIPIKIFQIDDGYQRSVGDWLHGNSKFPNGMKPIAEKIKAYGYTPGIWLAPLAAEKKSFIYKEKQDWILKDSQGKPVAIGYNPLWSGWFYALDIYNEEVRQYLRNVFDTVLNDWGFGLVKLDFLYGVGSIPQHGKCRGEVMRDAMLFLRECAGEKMILGCGVPLSAAEGLTEYCRIGPDIHLSWDFSVLKWMHARERPSTYNAIHNTISRRQLSGQWFWNDPDVFILRKNKNLLSFNEQYSLLLANVLFGHMLFTSDHIGEYDADTLQLYQSIFPLMEPEDLLVQQDGDFYKVNFRIRNNYYLVLINLSDTMKMYKLPVGLFFDNITQDWIHGGKMIEIPKHTSRCFLQVGVTPFALAGTKGHFFAGSEVINIYLSGNKLEVEWAEGGCQAVTAYFKVPTGYQVEAVNGSTDFRRIEKKDFSLIEIKK